MKAFKIHRPWFKILLLLKFRVLLLLLIITIVRQIKLQLSNRVRKLKNRQKTIIAMSLLV